jgi:hypothetical protein
MQVRMLAHDRLSSARTFALWRTCVEQSATLDSDGLPTADAVLAVLLERVKS